MCYINKSLFGVYHSIFKLLYLVLMALLTSSEVLIVYSNSSLSLIGTLIEDLKARTLSSSIEILSCSFDLFEEEILIIPNVIAVFDITNSLNYQFAISKFCESNFIPHFLVTDNLIYQNKWTFSLASSKKKTNEALITTLSYFNWTDGIEISSTEKYSISQLNMLNSYSEKIKLFSVGSETYIQEFVGKELMNLGSSLFYISTDKNTSLEIQQTLVSSKMIMSGSGILFIGESSYETVINGALGIVDKGKEEVDSNDGYLSVAISEMIFMLNKFSNSDNFLDVLLKFCPEHYCVNQFSIINIQEGKRKLVGSITNGNFLLSSPIIFPENTTEIPVSQKKILTISANDGINNPGSAPLEIVNFYKRGLILAIKDMNKGAEILQNFELKLNEFDCGANVYDEKFLFNCFRNDKDKIGLAHIVAGNYVVAVGEIKALGKLNITVPFVGATNVHQDLSNTTKYPFYTRVSLPSTITFSQIPLLLKVMGWSNIAILYQNDSFGISANDYISQASIKQNINILNNLRMIPILLTREQLLNYTEYFQEIINTNVRMIVLAINTPLVDYVTELFYDLGMRRGDVIFFTALPGWLATVANKDEYTYKRIEIAIPMLTSFQSPFMSVKGKQVHDELYEAYGNTEPATWACLYYDAGLLIGHAFDWTINQGNDYHDPNILEKAIRTVRFTGCSGKMYIQKGSNDAQLSSFTIQSNSYNTSSGILKAYNVGYFTPTGSKILSIETPFVYPDGTINKPSDFRITRTNCPFEDKLKQTFYKGRILLYGICFFTAALTIILAFIIWKKLWNIEIKEHTNRAEISIPDIIVGTTIAIEFFQMLSQGPDIRPINSFIADIGDTVSLNLASFIKLENGIFWCLAIVIITLCGMWAVFCVNILFHLDEKYNYIWLLRVLGFLADNSMPFLGNLCFIPFISILLEVFVCDYSIGDNFADSYLSIDCYQFCWQDNHIIYVVLSIFSLIFYIFFSVLCRPLWQEFEHSLHVKSLTVFLMIKTDIQVIVIAMSKTVKRSSQVAHGFLFTGLIFLYILFLLRFKAYNYGRFNWWHKLTLVGVFWASLLSTINILTEGAEFPWIALILGGWIIIIIIGFIIQKKKYPSLLYRKPVKDTSTLFKFAFTFGKKSREHHSKLEHQKLDFFK